jgi:hypothetical protein
MDQFRSVGWILVFVGGFVLLMGILLLLAGRIPFLGRLPGDIRIEREGFRLYIPLVTSLLLSLLLTILLNVVVRLLRK